MLSIEVALDDVGLRGGSGTSPRDFRPSNRFDMFYQCYYTNYFQFKEHETWSCVGSFSKVVVNLAVRLFENLNCGFPANTGEDRCRDEHPRNTAGSNSRNSFAPLVNDRGMYLGMILLFNPFM